MIAPGGTLPATELKFPADWEFRIVVEDAQYDRARRSVAGCLAAHGAAAELAEGLRSGSGRYRTIKARVVLTGREMMERLAADLAKLDGVRVVL